MLLPVWPSSRRPLIKISTVHELVNMEEKIDWFTSDVEPQKLVSNLNMARAVSSGLLSNIPYARVTKYNVNAPKGVFDLPKVTTMSLSLVMSSLKTSFSGIGQQIIKHFGLSQVGY